MGPDTGVGRNAGWGLGCKNDGNVVGGGLPLATGKNGTLAPLFIVRGVRPLLLMKRIRFVTASTISLFVIFSGSTIPTFLAIRTSSSFLVVGSNNRL